MDTAPAPTTARAAVALAEPADAFALAALHLQHDVGAGARPEPGFLDRYADWWLARRADRPTWLATGPDGDPWGVLDGAHVLGVPRVGRSGEHLLVLEFAYVVPGRCGAGLGTRLLGEALGWARGRGCTRVVAPAADPARLAAHGFDAAGAVHLLDVR